MDKASLGFYFKTIRLIEKLRRVHPDTLIVDPKNQEDGVLDQVDELCRRLGSHLPEQPSASNIEDVSLSDTKTNSLNHDNRKDSKTIQFQPFSEITELYGIFVKFANKLAEAHDSSPANSGEARIGIALQRELRNHVDRLYGAIHDEVGQQWVFFPPPQKRQYDSSDLFLIGEQDHNIYNQLPRITRQQLEDAGKCLTYGMPGASSGLALQAVESALRYYYRRHIEKPKERIDWIKMLAELRQEKMLPGDIDVCFHRLDRLGKYYRNAVAHGRAMYEGHKLAKSLESSERTFVECWGAIRDLYSQVAQRRQLGLRIEISDQLTFDSLLATYLFYWNPELPDIIAQSTFVCRPGRPPDKLVDSTALHKDQREWTTDTTTSLSKRVKDKLQIQQVFADTIEVLINYGQDCYFEGRIAQTGVNIPSEQDADLFDILEGLRLMQQKDPVSLLRDAWAVFDQFLDTELSPTDSSLLSVSNFRTYFDALRKH